jgi:galactonate dehydratase
VSPAAARIAEVRTLRHPEQPNLLWVELVDSDGVAGLGETFSLADAVESYIHEGAADYLLGEDPRDIVRHWTSLQRQRGRSGTGTEARGASAIDIALWDLLGHRTGLPLYQLLGGRHRPDIRVYNTCGGPNYVRERAVAGRQYTGEFVRDRYDDLWAFKHDPQGLAKDLLDEGITAMKIWPFDDIAVETGGLSITGDQLRAGFEPIARIREAYGERMDIALELHGRWSLPAAVKIVRVADEFDLMWVEDPVRLDNLDALQVVCASTRTPVLVGETLGGRFQYLELLRRTDVSIVMSDPCWTGGVSEIRRIADLTAVYQRGFTPHDCTGPVGLAVGTHAAVYAETGTIQEMVRAFRYGWYGELATGHPRVEQGRIAPAERPGHGITLRHRDVADPPWRVRTSATAGGGA